MSASSARAGALAVRQASSSAASAGHKRCRMNQVFIVVLQGWLNSGEKTASDRDQHRRLDHAHGVARTVDACRNAVVQVRNAFEYGRAGGDAPAERCAAQRIRERALV